MKRFFHVLTTMILISAVSWAQGTPKKAETKACGGVEQALLEMERNWAAAALKSDPAPIDAILADSWSAISVEGKITTRAQSLDDTKKSKFTRSEPSEMKVRMINADTATATGAWTGGGTGPNGEKIDTSGRWPDVFAHQGGKGQSLTSPA